MDLDTLRTFCLSLPGTTEDVKWGADLCFLVGSKMYCATGVEGAFAVSLKVREEEFEELCERSGITPAPYLARAKWVLVTGGDTLSKPDWERYIMQSYELIRAKLPVGVRKKILGNN